MDLYGNLPYRKDHREDIKLTVYSYIQKSTWSLGNIHQQKVKKGLPPHKVQWHKPGAMIHHIVTIAIIMGCANYV